MSPAKSHDLLAFVAITYAVTWVAMVPAILAFRGWASPPMPLVVLGAVIGSAAPSLVALALVRWRGEGVRSLFALDRPTSLAQRLGWCALALLLPAMLHLSGAAIASLFGAPASVWAMGLPSNGDQWGILIIAPFGEEVGWRGLLQRRAEQRWGAVRASLWVGVVWALWHVPMFLARPPGALDLVAGVVTILAGAFVFAALFRASGGSVWVAIAAHAGVHCDNTTRVGGPALGVTCAMFVVAAIGCGAWMAKDKA